MNCSDCIFAISYDKKQGGCFARLDLVDREEKLTDDGYWDLWGVCQYHRTAEWAHSKKPLEDQKEIAREEAKLSFDICIRHEEDLPKFRSLSYDKKNLWCSLLIATPQRFLQVANGKELNVQSNERLTFNVDTSTDWRILFGREAKGTFFGCFDDMAYIPNKFFEWLDVQINDHGFRFAVAHHNDDVLMSKMHFDNVQLSIKNIIEVCENPINLIDLTTNCIADKTWNKGAEKWV